MHTVETVLESLKKFDIQESDIQAWEKALQIEVPVDEYGRKQYSPHHVNLFKNIKKHLALGRTLSEIRQIVTLPPLETSHPREEAQPVVTQPEPPSPKKSAYASVPRKPVLQGGGAASVVQLVNRLNGEKDQLYKKLLATEKLNSHLYSANNMFHRKVKELNNQLGLLRERIKENENFKLLDEKSKLHKQLLEIEKNAQYKDEEILAYRQEMENIQARLRDAESRYQELTQTFDASRFCGDWMENGHLIEIVYDNFGINIESERIRLFRISDKPQRVYGSTAIVPTTYQYETNNLWKRNETMTVTYINNDLLEGELLAEYILDGVPVAKAIYRVSCKRSNNR